jgi:hypothetical protein
MFPTKKLKIILLILSITLAAVCAGLAGCTPARTPPPPADTPSAAPTTPPTFTSVAPLPTPTPGNQTILPVSTPISSPAPIPISTATEIFPLDNLRMAYIADGNLYVQDGSNPLKKLSDSGKDWYPMFSDDGEKIVFYRGKTLHDYNSIFSVNADGSQMQEIITKDWLDALSAGTKAGHLVFIPNTHQIIFNTYLCPEYDPASDTGCTVGLFIADTDTETLKEIMPPALGGRLPWYGDSRWLGNFSISPDGKLLAVANDGQVDILKMDGKVVHQSIMEYQGDMPSELYPRVYWLSDLSGLIAALPAEIDYRGPGYSGDPTYTIWRYTFHDNITTQILLDPPPAWTHMESNDVLSVSPNREWVIYFTEDYQLYKGNLLNENKEILLPYGWFLPMQWSSDNTHFANNGNSAEPILGSVDAPPGYIFRSFVGWIDAKRFIYIPNSAESQENIQLLIGEIDEGIIVSYRTNVFVPREAPYPYNFTFIVMANN